MLSFPRSSWHTQEPSSVLSSKGKKPGTVASQAHLSSRLLAWPRPPATTTRWEQSSYIQYPRHLMSFLRSRVYTCTHTHTHTNTHTHTHTQKHAHQRLSTYAVPYTVWKDHSPGETRQLKWRCKLLCVEC